MFHSIKLLTLAGIVVLPTLSCTANPEAEPSKYYNEGRGH